MSRMKDAGRNLLLGLWVVLACLTAGCSSGAHSTASRPTETCQPTYLAQISCWDTESCCILKNPVTAANRCMVSPMRIAEVLNGVKTVYETTQAAGWRTPRWTPRPVWRAVADLEPREGSLSRQSAVSGRF
jgi:hypothetical protein